nr:MAG TPA: hypothetical protein [Caudoviricetes sp.]
MFFKVYLVIILLFQKGLINFLIGFLIEPLSYTTLYNQNFQI